MIPFVPAQLTLYDPQDTANKSVVVQRRIPVHFDTKKLGDYTEFAQKFDAQNNPTPLYQGLVEDRARQLGVAFAGASENALYVQAVNDNRNEQQSQELLIQLAQNILSFTKVYAENTPVAARYFASFTQLDTDDRAKMVQSFIRSMDAAKEKIKTEKSTLKTESDQLKSQGQFLRHPSNNKDWNY